ncbi:hypothetical protein BH23CHL5_BH23CHL5_20680 [soil metagenome]
MGAAIDYATSASLGRTCVTVQQNATFLRNRRSSIPGVTVRDMGRTRSGIGTFDVSGYPSQKVVDHLKLHKINAGTTGISSTRFDMEARGLQELVLTSVHYFTSVEEVDRLANAIERLA